MFNYWTQPWCSGPEKLLRHSNRIWTCMDCIALVTRNQAKWRMPSWVWVCSSQLGFGFEVSRFSWSSHRCKTQTRGVENHTIHPSLQTNIDTCFRILLHWHSFKCVFYEADVSCSNFTISVLWFFPSIWFKSNYIWTDLSTRWMSKYESLSFGGFDSINVALDQSVLRWSAWIHG